MAQSSLPIFLEPNWQQPQGNNHHPDPRQVPAFLPPPPTTAVNGGGIRPGSMAYRARMAMMTQPEMVLKCPRCDSTNTKFCYFNNYSLTQPRHFCKTCRRYWTRGGALRNVPVGGGFRKNKKKKNKSNPSKSPSATQTQLGNSRSMGDAIISTNCNIESTTSSMSHFPQQPLQLPSINPSLQQHLSRFGSPPNNSALNVPVIHIENLNSGREFDQWKPPFIVAGLDPPAPTAYRQDLVNNFGANTSSSLQYNSTPFSRIPMKNEDQNQNQNQEEGMLSNFLRPAYQNSHFWGGDHQSSWTDLSALSSSSSSHLL